MFLIEAVAGILSNSTALLADTVYMLGDAIIYGFSLYKVVHGLVPTAEVMGVVGVVALAGNAYCLLLAAPT